MLKNQIIFFKLIHTLASAENQSNKKVEQINGGSGNLILVEK